MHGFRLDVETHIITAAATSVQNLTKCIRGIGIEIDDLILEPLAAAEAVLEPEEKLDGVMMADIGGSTTDIAYLKITQFVSHPSCRSAVTRFPAIFPSDSG